jgi:hypothetical protein
MRDSLPNPSARTGFWLLIGLLAMFAAGKAVLFDTLDPDCFWHLRVAAQLHRDGIGSIVDDLSFASSKQPWTPYSWLAELGMKAVWDAGGFRLAVAVTSGMQAVIVLLLALICVEMQTGSIAEGNCRHLAAVVATAIGAFLILPYLSFRPVTMAFVLLFSIVWLIIRDQRILHGPGRKAGDRSANGADWPAKTGLCGPGCQRSNSPGWVWLIVPLTILLTNIHLFSFFVPAICFAMAIGAMLEQDARGIRRFSQLATATTLACLATPMLPGLAKTIFFYSAQDKMVTGPVIAEMQSFARGPMGWIAAMGVLGMLGCIAWRHRLLHPGQLICIAVATLLMLKLGRFAPLFALAACPALAATLPGLKDRLLAKPAVVIALACVLIIGTGRVVASFPGKSVTLSAWVNRHGKDAPGYPCAAADFVDRSVPHTSGHLINEFSWGGYLAWRLADKYQVLLDGRTQVYPQSLWQATYLGSDADRQKFLAAVTADAALIPSTKSAFRDTLIRLGWQSVYKDDRAEVLVPPLSSVARIE